MKRNHIGIVLAVFVLLFACASIYGQEVHKMTADIPNAFTVSGKQLPAGRYVLELQGTQHQTMTIRSTDGKQSSNAMISTSIGGEKSLDGKVVFDRVGEEYTLSEVWFPGHDGFLLTGYRTGSEHKHSTVKGTPAK